MVDKERQIEGLRSLLTAQEIILPSSPDYKNVSRTWAVQANLKPDLVIQPKDLPTLSKSISYLANTTLDFRIRCSGVGNASAKDVLVSLAAFKSFSFNPEDETITFGAGHTWGEIDQKVEQHALGYAATSARCTFVGVGGSILHGGQSWLSSEYGLISDPQNLLDAQVIKLDGTVIWASEEPELMWALRGGGGGFAVVATYKIRVYKYPSSIFCGQIIYPLEAMPIVAREAAAFAARCDDPKVAMHLYCLDMSQGTMTSQEPNPGISIFAYDARGEEHGRSADGFKWALEIEGAIDMTHAVNFRQVNESFGQSNTHKLVQIAKR
jgi:FAD/FMN-containing dehydrogenase